MCWYGLECVIDGCTDLRVIVRCRVEIPRAIRRLFVGTVSEEFLLVQYIARALTAKICLDFFEEEEIEAAD